MALKIEKGTSTAGQSHRREANSGGKAEGHERRTLESKLQRGAALNKRS
jgi:hypothetical protein